MLPKEASDDSGKTHWTKGNEHHSMGDFLPIQQLGFGDMGDVHLVVHRKMNTPFAMKVMNKDVLSKRNTIRHADQEKDILLMVHHPFLPSLRYHFETEKHRVLVMDYCCGNDLNVLRNKQPQKKFSDTAARFYAAEVVVALEYLHNLGIVYRDLKPENILIQCSGHIMLTDFDLSVLLPRKTRILQTNNNRTKKSSRLNSIFKCVHTPLDSKEYVQLCVCAYSKDQRDLVCIRPPRDNKRNQNVPEVAKTFSFVGTQEYLAPEVLRGTGHDFAVDWWALGILLYEMIFGATPFVGVTKKETFHNILFTQPEFPSPQLIVYDLIQRLLVKDPSKRLGNFGQGVQTIKSHKFFRGVQWQSLMHIARPPFVPPPFSFEEKETSCGHQVYEMEEYLAAKEFATSERRRTPRSQRRRHNATMTSNKMEQPPAATATLDELDTPVMESFYADTSLSTTHLDNVY